MRGFFCTSGLAELLLGQSLSSSSLLAPLPEPLHDPAGEELLALFLDARAAAAVPATCEASGPAQLATLPPSVANGM